MATDSQPAMVVTSPAPGQAAAATAAAMAIRWSPRGVDLARRQRASLPLHHQIVPLDLGRGPEGPDQLGRPGQTVGLLDPELADVAEPGGAGGRGRGHGQDGHLVEGGDLRRLDHGAVQQGGVAGQRPVPLPASSTSMVAPIRRSTPTNPRRSALRWMPVTVTRLPGMITLPTSQKAAWEGSPGTV